MADMDDLALLGGPRAINRATPHEVWPPLATKDELDNICLQRQSDISIKGRSGPIEQLETEFLEFLERKRKFVISFNSGTSALFAAYFAMGIKPNTEVIGPAITYHAALSPVFALGGSIVLADIDQKTRCIDPVDVERKITERTRVLTVVHQWGHPADLDSLLRIAQKYNLSILEDCSHAHGSRYKGRMCGTFGDAAVFSLQAAKPIFAGEGGILVTDNSDIHDRATLLGHYRDRSRDEIQSAELQKYWVTGFGLKLRMSPLNAIVASYSLRAFPKVMEGRQQCLSYFNLKLREFDFIQLHEPSQEVTMGGWYGFKPLYLPDRLNGLPRETLIKALKAEGAEIDAPSAPVLSTLPLYSSVQDPLALHVRSRSTPSCGLEAASFVERHGLSLPTFYNFDCDKETIDEYILAIRKVAHHSARLS